MMKRNQMKSPVVLCVVLVAGLGCQREPTVPPAKPESASQPTNRIDIPPTVRSNLGVSFAKAERRNVEQTIRIPGAFELLPEARHEYRLSLPGTVALKVEQYQEVASGDLLYRLRSPKWPELQHEIIEAEQEIDSSRARIELALANLQEQADRVSILNDRLAALSDAGVRNASLEAEAAALQAGLPSMESALRQAETHLSNANRAREHALHRASVATGFEETELVEMVEHDGASIPAYRTIDSIEVRATTPGVVESLAMTDGGYGEAPSLVLSTVKPEGVRLRGMAMQSDLPRIGESPLGQIVPPSARGENVDAIESDVIIGLDADPVHRTVAVLATPRSHRSWMRPGVSAFLELVDESSGGPAIAIPRAAIVKDGMTHVFFRRDPSDPNRAIRVEADLGTDDGRWIAINSGLALGDEVVVDGAYELNLASETGGMNRQGGHFHADGTWHAEEH